MIGPTGVHGILKKFYRSDYTVVQHLALNITKTKRGARTQFLISEISTEFHALRTCPVATANAEEDIL